MKRYDLSLIPMADILRRDAPDYAAVETAVADILKDVRENGDEALLRYALRFDGAALTDLFVSEEELDAAAAQVDPALIKVLTRAADNIRAFHARQLPRDMLMSGPGGALMGVRVAPVGRAGVYVPGGTASYPSSVLMNLIPAKLAGVPELIMATPPRKDGSISPIILLAARLAGADRIFKAGGAQAVGALAYGTQSVPRVDKITGPGNIYVATAKRQVSGLVGIDMVAGPSEILIIADAGADPEHVAADLLSQAEHDRLATAVLISDAPALLDAVEAALARQLPLLPREDIARASLDNNGKLLRAPSLFAAVDAANALAPEHLELCVRDPFALLTRVQNAGSVFLGYNTPEAVGDYYAGVNHILPTGGAARFSSPLGVEDFVKRSQFLYYTPEALAADGADVAAFAEAEGLRAHARSVLIRKGADL